MSRLIRWYDYITFNIYFFGLTTLSQTMGLVTPLLVQQFVGVSHQGTYYGNFRLYTLMVALLAQSLMGLLSDRSTISWGRRRPFILVGTVITAVLTILIGFTAGMEGMAGLLDFACHWAFPAELQLTWARQPSRVSFLIWFRKKNAGVSPE